MTPDELAAIRARDAKRRHLIGNRSCVHAEGDRRALLGEVDRLTRACESIADQLDALVIASEADERDRIREEVEALRLPPGEDSRLQRYREETLDAVLRIIDGEGE